MQKDHSKNGRESGDDSRNPNRSWDTHREAQRGYSSDSSEEGHVSGVRTDLSSNSSSENFVVGAPWAGPFDPDMRTLKTTLWESISELKDLNNDDGADDEVEISFTAVFASLCRKLRQQGFGNVSLGVAFSALMHVAGERNLRLSQSNDLKEIHIIFER